MKLLNARVVSNQSAYPGVNLMWLDAPELALTAHPGQFVMLRCSDTLDPLLRRALSIHRIHPEPGHIAVLYGLGGPGTAYLQRRLPGDTVDVLGPLGKGYTVRPQSRNLLLVGVSWGLAPLIALAEEQVLLDRPVTLLAGGATAAQVPPSELLPPQVELQTATTDGSLGFAGDVTALVKDYWAWADDVFACGPMAFYRQLANAVAGAWPRKRIQVLAETPMACGVGACFACTLETRHGLLIACREGPKAYLDDLIL